MNPFKFVVQRPVSALMLIVALAGASVFGLNKMRAESYPPGQTPQVYVFLDSVSTKATQVRSYISSQFGSHSGEHKEEIHEEHHKVVVTSPKAQDVVITEQYVCQIHAKQHINVKSLEGGYLEQILVKEGQKVKKNDLLFKIIPTLHKAKLDAETAEAQLAQLELNYSKELSQKKVVSPNEVALLGAKLARAKAKADLAGAELEFTNVRAPFDGIVDRLHEQLGSLIKEGEILTTLSDNSVMWVYFNVPEARYLEYMASLDHDQEDHQIELMLANGSKFKEEGNIGAIEANFRPETGNIPFRADFPNPTGLLRHGQTGTVLIHRTLHDAMVIPQRATFENLDKRYVFVIGKDDVAHQREISVGSEQDDIFVINKGVEPGDRIVLEGTRQVHDGEKVEYKFSAPELVIGNLKNKAE